MAHTMGETKFGKGKGRPAQGRTLPPGKKQRPTVSVQVPVHDLATMVDLAGKALELGAYKGAKGITEKREALERTRKKVDIYMHLQEGARP